MAYVIRCEYLAGGAISLLKRSHSMVLWGPRGQAQTFATRGAAERAVARAAAADRSLRVEDADEAGDAPPAKSVLVVEDDAVFAYAVSKTLLRAGYAVFSAADAARAMALIEERACVDLLLADIRLPPGTPDGIEVARLVRERCPDIKVLFVTALRDVPVRGGRVLHKPIPLRTLVAEVGRAVGA